MNVEQAFVKSIENERVVEIVQERLNGRLKDACLHCQMEVPDSYDTILANDAKRKIAVSSPRKGWIAVVESKEVNDYVLLLELSRKLHTEVLAVVWSDAAGAWGYAEMLNGEVVKSYFSEEDDEMEDLLDSKLRQKDICQPLFLFREVVRERGNGWDIVMANSAVKA